jgi:hypothetical protein
MVIGTQNPRFGKSNKKYSIKNAEIKKAKIV